LDNASDVAQNLSQMGADLLVETLLNLEAGKLEPTPQNDAEASYARLIQKQDYLLSWRRSAWELHNQVRGFYPNCFTYFRGEPLKVTATLPLLSEVLEQLPQEQFQGIDPNWIATRDASSQDRPQLSEKVGTVVEVVKNRGPIVQTGSGLLLLQTVQPAGKRSQSGWDFVNGARLEVGEALTSDGGDA
jgi:methionyl-tRNA formyltransferase